MIEEFIVGMKKAGRSNKEIAVYLKAKYHIDMSEEEIKNVAEQRPTRSL